MDQKSFNPKKIKAADSTISGLYHAAGFLIMWIVIRSGLLSWLFTPFYKILDQYDWSYNIPYQFFFIIALSIFPALLGGYSLAKIRQAEDIRSFVTSYTFIFIFVFGLLSSPAILYHMIYWQIYDLYYYLGFMAWFLNFAWGFTFGGLLAYFLLRRWNTKLPKKQAIILVAVSFGFASLFTNGFGTIYGEFYYWMSALRILGFGFIGGIGLGVAFKADPNDSIHGHFYQRSTYI